MLDGSSSIHCVRSSASSVGRIHSLFWSFHRAAGRYDFTCEKQGGNNVVRMGSDAATKLVSQSFFFLEFLGGLHHHARYKSRADHRQWSLFV